MKKEQRIGSPVPCSPIFKKRLAVQRKTLQSLLPIFSDILGRFISGEGFDKPTIDEDIYYAVPNLMGALGTSAQTICDLSEESGFHTRDCICISRSAIETAVNICYILTQSGAAEKAIRHGRQLAFRNRNRISTIATQTVIDKKKLPRSWARARNLKDEVKEFSTTRGRSKNWSADTIEQKIAKIGNCNKLSMSMLHAAYFLCYSEASELLHGSLYGAWHFMGLTEPEEPQRTTIRLGNHIARQNGDAIDAVIQGINAIFIILDLHYHMIKENKQIAYILTAEYLPALKKSGRSK